MSAETGAGGVSAGPGATTVGEECRLPFDGGATTVGWLVGAIRRTGGGINGSTTASRATTTCAPS